jgi:pyrroloquinoline quinone biosynthesis protein B
MKTILLFLLSWLICYSCGKNPKSDDLNAPFIVVLGIAQDGGFPHTGCTKACCASAWKDPDLKRHVTCLGIVDPSTSQCWIIDATPDFPHQLYTLQNSMRPESPISLAGILLTHGHMGHYTGLMYLGREAMNAQSVPVYVMPRMRAFLESSGPWDQLVNLENIALKSLTPDAAVRLTEHIRIIPFPVPHRDEYSETIGFRIVGPNASCLFIPDIDKWERWEVPIGKHIQQKGFRIAGKTQRFPL